MKAWRSLKTRLPSYSGQQRRIGSSEVDELIWFLHTQA
jgi:hypothetical protein